MSRSFDMMRASADFACVSKHGKKVNRSHFSIVYHMRSSDDAIKCMRLGLVASKRTYKLAVDRNKAKRRVRALMQGLALDSSINISNFDILVIVRRSFNDANYKLIKQDMHKLLCKIAAK